MFITNISCKTHNNNQSHMQQS